jgi:hypothetical protein
VRWALSDDLSGLPRPFVVLSSILLVESLADCAFPNGQGIVQGGCDQMFRDVNGFLLVLISLLTSTTLLAYKSASWWRIGIFWRRRKKLAGEWESLSQRELVLANRLLDPDAGKQPSSKRESEPASPPGSTCLLDPGTGGKLAAVKPAASPTASPPILGIVGSNGTAACAAHSWPEVSRADPSVETPDNDPQLVHLAFAMYGFCCCCAPWLLPLCQGRVCYAERPFAISRRVRCPSALFALRSLRPDSDETDPCMEPRESFFNPATRGLGAVLISPSACSEV